MTTPSELSTILSKSKIAQRAWGNFPLSKRIDLLRDGITNRIQPIAQQLATTITNEMGKTLAESLLEVQAAIQMKGEWLDMVHEANEDVVFVKREDNNESEVASAESLIVRDPLGVVAVLSPWNVSSPLFLHSLIHVYGWCAPNPRFLIYIRCQMKLLLIKFPVSEISYLAIPALVAGNAVVVKPSEHTPLTGAMYCAALASALPDGVLQVVQGDGRIGEQLVCSDEIHMVAMTGSTATGQHIMKNCATNLKRLVLELGGKDPMIVFADADLDIAAKDAVANSLANAGQVCCSIERIYVEKSVQVEFEQKVVEIARMHRVGMPMEEGVTVGPLVSRMQLEHVKRQVQGSMEDGAIMLYESEIPSVSTRTTTMSTIDDEIQGGYFHPITVLGNVQQSMSIQKVETFGPIIAISTFNGSEEDAIALANDTEYGLTACVYTVDLEKASRIARRIRAGQVGINCYSPDEAHLKCPW